MNLLAAHTLKTLPDSIAGRRILLKEIIRHTKVGTELRQTAKLMLEHLEQQDRAQAEFSFKLTAD